MIITQPQFSCSSCGRLIDIGEPFLATATYPARSTMQAEMVDATFLMRQGEVLCHRCALDRLGVKSISKLRGAVFHAENERYPHELKREEK